MKIPEQLKNERFVRADSEKRAYEKGWTTTANYSYEEFEPGQIYGVLCGNNNLIVVDCDTQQMQDKLIQLEEFRDTFTVKTATKKLYHFYFRVDIPNQRGFRISNARKERVLDLQGLGTMVVGPGSELNGIGTYEIVNEKPIRKISYEYLKTILYNLEEGLQISDPHEKKHTQIFPDFDELCGAIKDKITVEDVLKHLNIKDIHSNMNCPLGHPSQGGKCFSHTGILWNCFHCNQAGNIFQLYMAVRKVSFLEARAALMKLAGLEDQLKFRVATMYADPRTRSQAYELMASEFKKMYHVYTIRNDKLVDIYIYKNGIYQPNGKTYINEFVRYLTGNFYRETIAKAVMEKIVVDTYIQEENFFVNPPINYIPFENVILDIHSMKTIPYSSKYRFFYKHPVVYDPLTKPEKTLDFIKDIVKNEDDVLTIQEIAGYLFWRENKFEKGFMFLGGGRNGKSKLIELLKNMVGGENTINITLATLEKDSFSLGYFHNKLANFSPDLSNETLELTGNFKSLVGRDKITANRKFKSPISFTNFAKMIFSTNSLPYTEDQSIGFLSKWVIIDFPFYFTEDPKPMNKSHKLKDPNIIDKISTPREMTGLVNWAFEGLHRLLKRGEFTKTNSESEIKQYWFTNSSSTARFWQDFIKLDKDSYIKVNDFNLLYSQWCQENNAKQDGPKLKNTVMRELGAVYGHKAGSKAYLGIKTSLEITKTHDGFEELDDEI